MHMYMYVAQSAIHRLHTQMLEKGKAMYIQVNKKVKITTLGTCTCVRHVITCTSDLYIVQSLQTGVSLVQEEFIQSTPHLLH